MDLDSSLSDIEPESGPGAVKSVELSFGNYTELREAEERRALERQKLVAQERARRDYVFARKLQVAQIESAQKTLEAVTETTKESETDDAQITKVCESLSTVPEVDKELLESQKEKQLAEEPVFRYWDPKLSYKDYLKSSNSIKLENTELCPYIMDDFDSFEQLLKVYGKNESFYDWVCYFDQYKFFTDKDNNWLSKNMEKFCYDNRAIRYFARVLIEQINAQLSKPGDMIRYRLLYYLMSVVSDKDTFIPIRFHGHVLPFVSLNRDGSIVYEPVSFRYRMLSKLLPRDVTVEKWDDYVVKHDLYSEVRGDTDPDWISQPPYLVVKMFYDRLPEL
jgi:hypothetical protein